MPTHIQISRADAADWTSDNTVLLLAEIGYEQDTFKAKIGDGSTPWNSLPYWDLGLGVSALFDAVGLLQTDVGGLDTDLTAEIAARIAGDAARQLISEKDVAGGYAGLDGSGKVLSSVLPAIAITDTFVVGSQVAMLALTAEVGDVAVRTDLNKSFILKTAGPTVLANWQELLTPTDAVLSVNGQTGIVTLTTTHITEGGNLYFTTARVLATALTGFVTGANTTILATDTILAAFQKAQGQINARFPIAGGDLTGTAGAGYVGLISQSAAPSNPSANNIRIYGETGRLCVKTDGGHIWKISAAGGTHLYQLPGADGQIALTTDIPGPYSPGYGEMEYILNQTGGGAIGCNELKNNTGFSLVSSTYLGTGIYKLSFDNHFSYESSMIMIHNCIDPGEIYQVAMSASISEADDHDIIITSLWLKPGAMDRADDLIKNVSLQIYIFG